MLPEDLVLLIKVNAAQWFVLLIQFSAAQKLVLLEVFCPAHTSLCG